MKGSAGHAPCSGDSIRMGGFIEQLAAGDASRTVLAHALQAKGPEQAHLFDLARQRRSIAYPTEEVEVRSVIEISNVCRQRCNYCNMGLKATHDHYVIGYAEFLDLVQFLHSKGRRVLLLQSGENDDQDYIAHVTRCVEGIMTKFNDMVVVLCLGNLSKDQYQQLRDVGATRYVLKFETSNPRLYSHLKPRDSLKLRVACLETLLSLGYEVGSGNMVGLPGQTVDDIVEDLYFLGRYKLAMESCTVFIPGESSHYRNEPIGDVDMALNMMALMRILYPNRLIPTTSSLEKARRDGQYLGLMAGANTVTVHDGTPDELKHLFPIYSTKRFTPQDDHFIAIVRRAGLRPARGALS